MQKTTIIASPPLANACIRLEGQRGLSEQIIEQRGDVKAIRATLERLERQIENATVATRANRRTR